MRRATAPWSKATLRATAFGVYEAFINGVPVGDGCPEPGLELLRVAAPLPQLRRHRPARAHHSVIGVELGNGWYRGRLAWHGMSNLYGSELGFFGQLDIEFADGHVQTVASDDILAGRPVRHHLQRPLRRADHRRPPAPAGLGGARLRAPATGWAGVRDAGVRRRAAG